MKKLFLIALLIFTTQLNVLAKSDILANNGAIKAMQTLKAESIKEIKDHSQDTGLKNEAVLEDKLASLGFGKMFALEPKEQLQKTFQNYLKYGNSHNIKKLRALYDNNYVNFDGFDIETYFKMIEQTWALYPNISYTLTIKDIEINGNYATVRTLETAKGIGKEPSEYLEDRGLIESTSEIIYYLQKTGNTWYITSDEILNENTSLKYGDAKNATFNISAPKVVPSGNDYTVSLSASLSPTMILLASISNEKIAFPPDKTNEVFRKVDLDGSLERVLKANTKGFNEHAVVSIGITKATIFNQENIDINVTGVAFVVTRINVVDNKYKNTKSVKTEVKY